LFGSRIRTLLFSLNLDAGERVQSAAMSGYLNLLWRDAGASRVILAFTIC
jgi:hypothetical protein